MKPDRTPRYNTSEQVGITIAGRPVPYQTGVLSKDFPKRLIRLKEASGLTWNAFSDAVGSDKKQLYRWREEDSEPCGGAYHSLVLLASMIPGGMDILMGEGFLRSLFKDWMERQDFQE